MPPGDIDAIGDTIPELYVQLFPICWHESDRIRIDTASFLGTNRPQQLTIFNAIIAMTASELSHGTKRSGRESSEKRRRSSRRCKASWLRTNSSLPLIITSCFRVSRTVAVVLLSDRLNLHLEL